MLSHLPAVPVMRDISRVEDFVAFEPMCIGFGACLVARATCACLPLLVARPSFLFCLFCFALFLFTALLLLPSLSSSSPTACPCLLAYAGEIACETVTAEPAKSVVEIMANFVETRWSIDRSATHHLTPHHSILESARTLGKRGVSGLARGDAVEAEGVVLTPRSSRKDALPCQTSTLPQLIESGCVRCRGLLPQGCPKVGDRSPRTTVGR